RDRHPDQRNRCRVLIGKALSPCSGRVFASQATLSGLTVPVAVATTAWPPEEESVMKHLGIRTLPRGLRPDRLRTRLAVETLESRWVPSQLSNSLGLSALKDLSLPPAGHSGQAVSTGPGFQVISQPDAGYLAATSKIDITVPDLTTVPSLTDGTETANF